ncbi:MAG: His/Gly/Thr/Pro-type tRNA ligase C-terminal domain-containing protein, partial [Candidatus Heimdallarchaeota archaeon]
IDYQTLEDETITIRDRDSMEQIRVEREELVDVLILLLSGENSFTEIKKLLVEDEQQKEQQ